MDIKSMAKNQQEATKLYGLVLRYGGFLKPLGGLPCEVTITRNMGHFAPALVVSG
jgi:hypothetical protein